MKKVSLFCLGMFTAAQLLAQSPGAFKYQAVARDGSGAVLASQAVSFRISILAGTSTGTAVYEETHVTSTNEFGLVSLEIGRGTRITGNLEDIDWGGNGYFLKIEMDPGGGSAYSLMGVSQLLSVPLALHARTVEIDQVNDADADPANELQVLQLSGTQLTLSKGGGTVTLPAGTGDGWGSQAVLTDATLAGNGTAAAPLRIADNGVTADKINTGAVTGIKIARAGATNGQALKWDGATWAPGNDLTGSGLWLQNGSKIYYNEGQVGIGTSDPQHTLHLNSTSVFSGIQFTNEASGSTLNDGFVIGQQFQSPTVNRYGLIRNRENSPLWISTNNLNYQLTLNPDGNVGVGSMNADAKLHVAGQIKITGGSPGTGRVLTSDPEGLATWQSPAGLTLPYSGVGSFSDAAFKVTNTHEGYVIVGSAESATGQNCGVTGQSFSVSGMGVYGVAVSETGRNYGIYGISNSEEGRGVAGYAGSTTGLNYGVRGFSASSSGIGVEGQGTSSTGVTFGVRGAVSSAEGYSGSFFGGRFFVESKVGIGNSDPTYKLDVTGDRIRLMDGSEWIAMRTDGSVGYLDLSFAGGKLVIQGSAADENVILNPSVNKVGIRTWTPQYELDVNGSIRAIGSVYYGGTIDGANGMAYIKPDYVFEKDYEKLGTEQVEEYLAREKHLPWVTSARQEKEENHQATDMTRMAFETLESVENVQLQVISQAKHIQDLEGENSWLKTENHLKQSKIEELEFRLSRLETLMGVKR